MLVLALGETVFSSLNQFWSAVIKYCWIAPENLDLIHKVLHAALKVCVYRRLVESQWSSAASIMVGSVLDYQDLYANGESGFDSGEWALKTAHTSKEASRRANYPIHYCEVVTNCAEDIYVRLLVHGLKTRVNLFEGKLGASSRGNSNSKNLLLRCCS